MQVSARLDKLAVGYIVTLEVVGKITKDSDLADVHPWGAMLADMMTQGVAVERSVRKQFAFVNLVDAAEFLIAAMEFNYSSNQGAPLA